MGNKQCTVLNVKLIRIDTERNILLIKGAVPGAPGTKLNIVPSNRAAKEN